MSVIKGLAAIQQELSKRPSSGDFEDKPKARYVNVPKGGSPIKLIPLQEIDEGSPNYKPEMGTSDFVLMHSNPDNFKKSAKCTADEGACWPCERGWKQKILLFINMLVDDGNEEPYVAIFNKGLSSGSVAGDLVSMAGDDDYDLSITDKAYKFARSDANGKTSYSLNVMPKAHGKDLTKYKDQLFDLEKYVFTVKYEKQEAYYLDGQELTTTEAPAFSTGGNTSADAEW